MNCQETNPSHDLLMRDRLDEPLWHWLQNQSLQELKIMARKLGLAISSTPKNPLVNQLLQFLKSDSGKNKAKRYLNG